MPKSTKSVSIIGGADGPTSIWLVDRNAKPPLKQRIQQYFYKKKRQRMAKIITPGTHTLEEVAALMREKYNAVEISKDSHNYQEQKKYLRENLILQHKPELLEGKYDVVLPLTDTGEEGIREHFRQIQERSDYIAGLPEDAIETDFHIYEIICENDKNKGRKKNSKRAIVMYDNRIEIQVDYLWETFGCSYSGTKQSVKEMRKIVRKLHLYYGVSKEDIAENNTRYKSLLSVLCN